MLPLPGWEGDFWRSPRTPGFSGRFTSHRSGPIIWHRDVPRDMGAGEHLIHVLADSERADGDNIATCQRAINTPEPRRYLPGSAMGSRATVGSANASPGSTARALVGRNQGVPVVVGWLNAPALRSAFCGSPASSVGVALACLPG